MRERRGFKVASPVELGCTLGFCVALVNRVDFMPDSYSKLPLCRLAGIDSSVVIARSLNIERHSTNHPGNSS